MHIIDSSVVLAFVRGEPGGERLADFVDNAVMSTVNLAETVTKCIELDLDPQPAVDFVSRSGIELIDLNAEHAILAGQLRRIAPKGVLSLGDRACIATAIKLSGTAVTADRIWSTLDLPCKIELIR